MFEKTTIETIKAGRIVGTLTLCKVLYFKFDSIKENFQSIHRSVNVAEYSSHAKETYTRCTYKNL